MTDFTQLRVRTPRRLEELFEQHVAPSMELVAGGRFEMGSEAWAADQSCGETPRHEVELSPFSISRIPVTNALYAVIENRRGGGPAGQRRHPVVNVTWHDAAAFAERLGCRLPTEAEWELACGAGSASQWCCDEHDLPRHAWYSENAGGEVRPVGLREPNSLGLLDMHGNIWEWCQDAYDQDYYSRTPRRDPVNSNGEAGGDRVCRGGSVHALAEMCRTRYRLHEPATFWAGDLGFRLAADLAP
jgi:formylglycine-generating enzyme required for sulfatase activity